MDAEVQRLEKELKQLTEQLDRVEMKLSNQKFMSKAPADVIEGVRTNGERLRVKAEQTRETLKELRGEGSK